MIEISECTKGSKKLLEFKRFVRLCKRLHVKMTVHYNVDADDIEIEFPDGRKVSSTLFEGLSDRATTSWIFTLYMIRR